VEIVLHEDFRLLYLGMMGEVGADESSVPWPVVFGIARRMDAQIPATVADVVLEGMLLGGVEDVARRAQEYDDVISRECIRREHAGVFREPDREPAFRCQTIEHVDAVGDGGMPVARRSTEDEDMEIGLVTIGWVGPQDRRQQGQYPDERGGSAHDGTRRNG